MAEIKSDEFGTRITYYKTNWMGDYFQSLPEGVAEFGSGGFSPEGITSFLTFRYPISNLTMFRDWQKIPCGSKLVNGKVTTYWYPRFENRQISFNKAMTVIEDLLVETIRKLSESRVIAIPMSGGIDSSLIVALARKIYPNKNIYTYSAGFHGDDEFEHSRIVAKLFNTIHKEVVLTKEDFIGSNSLLKPLIKRKGEPLHPNEIALAEAENTAKNDGCEIALCGEGGDDIFGGFGQNLRMYINYKKDTPFIEFFLNNYRYFTLEKRRKIVRDEYLVDDFSLLSSVINEDEVPDDLRNVVFYLTQKFHTPGLIIRGANAMRFNDLELGFPYINMELVNFVNSLPFEYKLHWKSKRHEGESTGMNFREISERLDIPKYILKKIAERYLPHQIIYRKKYGFPVPFDKWLGDLNKWSLNPEIFKTNDIHEFSGWEKFMLINLNTFLETFHEFDSISRR